MDMPLNTDSTIRDDGNPGWCAKCPARPGSFCAAVPDTHIETLERSRQTLRFNRRQMIAAQNNRATSIFNITSGVVKLSRATADGRTQIVDFRQAGDLVAFPESKRHVANAEALTNVTLCRFSRPRLARLLRAFPLLQAQLLTMSSRALTAAEDHMVLLGCKGARARVATFLLRRWRQSRRSEPGLVESVNLPMTRAELANYLGLTTETASRVMNGFAREKIVTLVSARTVDLLDLKALQVISESGR